VWYQGHNSKGCNNYGVLIRPRGWKSNDGASEMEYTGSQPQADSQVLTPPNRQLS